MEKEKKKKKEENQQRQSRECPAVDLGSSRCRSEENSSALKPVPDTKITEQRR